MDTLLIVAAVALPIIIVWMLAVGDLMTRRDNEFPGQADKLAWAIILTFTGLFGAIVYVVCKPRQKLDTSYGTDVRSSADEPLECMKCGATIPDGSSKCPSCGWSYGSSE